jgi:hypothetical protein
MGEFDPGFHDPPKIEDLQAIKDYITELMVGLQGGNF